jgi:hypothetical protein
MVFIRKSGERGLLPLSSHGTGVGGVRATTRQPPAGLVRFFFLLCQVRGVGRVDSFGFMQVGRGRE